MDFDASFHGPVEAMISEENKPGSQGKKRQPKVAGRFFKMGTIHRSENLKNIDKSFTVDTVKKLKNRDPTNSGIEHCGVGYSMNKKGRWNLVNQFNAISQFQGNDITVSALESRTHCHNLWDLGHKATKAAKVYHGVRRDPQTEQITEFHRKPKAYSSHVNNIKETVEETAKRTNNRDKKKKLQLSSRTNHRRVLNNLAVIEEVNAENVSTKTHLDIEYNCVTNDLGLLKKMYKKTLPYKDDLRIKGRNTNNRFKYLHLDMNNGIDSDFMNIIETDEYELDTEIHNHYRKVELSDFIVAPIKTKDMQDSHSDSSYSLCSVESNISSDTWSLVDLDNIDHQTKPWVQRISDPGPFLPWKFRKLMLEDQSTASTSTISEPPPIPNAKFDMIRLKMKIGNESLDDEYLRNTFGACYFEVNCIGRRFCIDISKAVRNVSLVSHGDPINTTVLLVFQLHISTVSPFKLLEETPEEEDWSYVSVWLNGGFNDEVVFVPVNDEFDIQDVHSVNDVIRMAAMIGTQSAERFVCVNGRACAVSIFAPSMPVLEEMRDVMQPGVSCLRQDSATSVALKQSGLQPQVQRVKSVIESYPMLMGETETECQVCLQGPVSQIGMCLAQCQHWFCDDCWTQYCLHQIYSARVPIKCPETECNATVDYDVLCTMLPLPQCVIYGSLLRDQHMVSNAHKWMWCPNHKCSRVILLNDSRVTSVVHCLCGSVWCKDCGGAPHFPITCDQNTKYLERLQANGDDLDESVPMDERVVNVKRCPHCNFPMEKGFGCNHIVCRCGGQFCWSCLSNWDSGVHYNCNLTSTKHQETMILRDVNIKAQCFMSSAQYEKAVFHRRASRHKYKDILKQYRCLLSRKRVGDVSAMESHVMSIRLAVKDLRSLIIETHNILQYVHVWMDLCKTICRKDKEQLAMMADKTNYSLQAVINNTNTELTKFNLWKQKTKTLLINILNRIISLSN